MTETIKELHPVARKPHRCDWCGGIIEKGEQYVRHTLKYENEPPYDWCSHKDCDEIVRRMKGCQDKFDALAMFRNCGLLEPSERKDNGCE